MKSELNRETNEDAELITERNALRQRERKLYSIKPENADEANKIDRELDQIHQQLDELNQIQRERQSAASEECVLPAPNGNDDWTPAEIEDNKRIKTERAEAKRKRAAAVKKNPRLAFKDTFKADYWPGGYANFPVPVLAALPFKSSPFIRSNTKQRREERNTGKKLLCLFLRDYVLMRVAKHIYTQKKKDVMNATTMPQPVEPPRGFNPENPRHQAIGAAMFILKRRGGDIGRFKRHWRKGEQLLADHQLIHTEQAHVQFSLDLLGSEYAFLSERDLRVLMAVNSCCGQKGWHQINWQILAWRAVGAVNETMLEQLDVDSLSRKQVERALSKLREKGLIRLYVWQNRISFVAKRGKGCLSEENFQAIVRDELQRRLKRKSQKADSIVLTDKHGNVTFTNKENFDEDILDLDEED